MSHQVDPFSAPCPRGQLAEALGHPLQGPDARRRWKVPGGDWSGGVWRPLVTGKWMVKWVVKWMVNGWLMYG